MPTLSDFGEKYYALQWRQMDWDNAEKMLRNLQKRLATAEYEHNSAMVTNIQKMITDSTEIRALAVKKVTDQSGKRPGIDGVKWLSDADKMKGAMSLNADDYQAQPFRRVIIQDKKKMKSRHIGIPTIKDRAMQTLYAYALDPIAEACGDKKSFAFRNGRSALDVHYYICEAIKYPASPEWILVADVKSCYESISHAWLMKHIPMHKTVLLEFLKAGFVFGKELFATEHGISLGMSISPIIANMTLDGLQRAIFDLQSNSRNIDYADGNFIRYADDIIVTARTKESATKIKGVIEKFLSARGLKLSEKKTKIVNVSNGFDFLSRNYCKKNGILCVTPSERAIESFEENLHNYILNKGKQQSQRRLIKGINSKLQGWASYHRIEDSMDAFRHIDCLVQSLLLRLMQKLFPKKTKKQIIEQYWYEEADGTKVYALPHRKDIRVFRMKDVILTEHVPVVLNKNPYIDTDYFDTRLESQDIQKINGDFKAIWKRQKGKCYYCGRPIQETDLKKLIHIGSLDDNAPPNLAYIHKSCDVCEAVFIQTNIENPSETDIFEIVDEICCADENVTEYKKYNIDALKTFFKNCTQKEICLTFSEIEKILDAPLNSRAYNFESFWHKKSGLLSGIWQSQNFDITLVDIKNKKIFFRKNEKKDISKLVIPKIFLTDRIPNEAKYEVEHFFEYIRKKYGI
ncbi:MAG: reverse transcriptase domain-containing protein [Clostridia bacterium]|nr:reverse transcriptase domain-containing protein [Clostridia bacterium]